MQEQQGSEWPIDLLLHRLVHSSHLNIHQGLLSFLGSEEVGIIAESTLHLPSPPLFYQIAIAQHFLHQYINRVDRTNYYLFYDDPQFKKIESQNTLSLIADNYHALQQHHRSFGALFESLEGELKGLELGREVGEIIRGIFLETDLSLPKMKRQTIGMYCESALQDYLCLLRFPEEDLEEVWTEQGIVQLKQSSQQELQHLISYFPYYHSPLQQPAATTHEKARILRFSAFKVTCSNWRDFLVQGFRMHNLLVILFALCSQLVHSYHLLLTHISDPFLRFTEFTLRANLYRNLILNLQEKLGFLLEDYSRFYENVYSPPQDRPPFRFWLPALSTWTQLMKSHHPANNCLYAYVTTRMREGSLLEFLRRKTEKLPSFFCHLKDQVEMHIFSESRRAEVYSANESRVELEEFFESNEELYEVITKDYLEYMVDVSVNQFSVHRCGHSRHAIAQHPLFLPFKDALLHETSLFHAFIKHILYESSPQELRLGFVKEVIREDLAFASLKVGKPVVVREMVERVNEWVGEEVKGMSEFAVFEEEGVAKYRINWEFEEADSLLDYFCGKYGIEDCPQKLQYYFSCQHEEGSERGESECEDSFQYQCEEYNSEEGLEGEEEGEGEMEDSQ